jgi:ubiquinol-cytochrome c reductase core subunit 2
VSKLDSGVVIVSLENNSPVQRVAAVINAGSRDESSSELGASHALRVYSSLATRNFSLFGIARNLDQVGADFR